MPSRVIHHLLFLCLWGRVSHAAGVSSVEVVCGDLSTLQTAGRLDSSRAGEGAMEVSVHHPAMGAMGAMGDGGVDLVPGLRYQVTFSSRDNAMAVQGVAVVAATQAGQLTSSLVRDLAAWPSGYRCNLRSPSPRPPSPVQPSPSTPFAGQASGPWASPSSEAVPELLTSEVDVTSMPLFIIMVNSSSWIQTSQELCQPQGCKQYFTAETGVLTSPGYPSNYPDSSNCIYVIYPNTSSPIDLQFQVFQLEQSYSNRCVDSVTVSDWNSVKQVLCGHYDAMQLRRLRYISNDSMLVLRFVSDNKFSSRGFRAVYATLSSKECDATHRHLNGTIRSPALPSPPSTSPTLPSTYLPNTVCRHLILLPPPYRLRFYVHDLHFSDPLTGHCTSGDTLHFRDLGSHNQATVTCRTEVSARDLVFESSGSRVEMVFSSDHLFEGKGFEIFYAGVPSCRNETFRGSSGSVSSVNFPAFYPNMQECFYTVNLTTNRSENGNNDSRSRSDNVSGRSKSVIEVSFREFFTESDSKGDARLRDRLCVRDFVEISAGKESHRVCGNWTGKEHLLYFRFASSLVTFRLVTDEQGTRRGFLASWRLLEGGDNASPCLSTVLHTQHFTFQVVYRGQSWEDGQADCQSRGGMLASVLNNSTQYLLSQHLLTQRCGDARAYWIGANDRQWESDFYWADRSKVRYSNWFPGFPGSGALYGGGPSAGARYGVQPSDDGQAEEDCVELRRRFALPGKGHVLTSSFFWNDRRCDRRNPYVCQVRPQTRIPEPVACDRNVTLTPRVPEVRLRSPGYPHDAYPDHTLCTVFLHAAPPDAMLEVEFWDFQLENVSGPGR
ncbi:hypothetical protein ACOMHN_009993 [Nucella lapillus]